jgi:hypothetical protein
MNAIVFESGTDASLEPLMTSATLERLQTEFTQRGAAVWGPAALDTKLHSRLLDEALTQRQNASWSLVAEQCHGEITQRNLRGHLGPEARRLLSSATILSYLKQITGYDLSPSWGASCYTYYEGPGQHMGEHCDKWDACRFGMLVYLQSVWLTAEQPSRGLQLHVFRGDNAASGLLLRITAHSNRIVFLNGSAQAHLRPALAVGEQLTMLAGCYQLATNV